MFSDAKVVCLSGLQFGDEGKGKLVDLFSSSFDYVVRYQGGDNAGHTIYHKGEKCVLRSIPSGIFNTSALIAPGTVVNPFLLLEEISKLEKLTEGSLKGKLFVSTQANVILDFHIEWDRLCEELREDSKIGSTLRGIGPAYADKSSRIGLKFTDLFDKEELRARLDLNLKLKNPIFQKYGYKTFDVDELVKRYNEVAQLLSPYLVDYDTFLTEKLSDNKKFLLEGSQGLLLDVDLGTYPFVTSSNIISSAFHGAYLSPQLIDHFFGVVKVYTTRVGEGPLLTELTEEEKEMAELIRERGNEYGSNTKRPRRIGWLDLNALKYSIRVGGITQIALTLVDVFNGFDTFKVCIGYENELGERVRFSSSFSRHLKPVYREFKSWYEDFSKVEHYSQLPKELQEFVNFLELSLQVKVSIVSFGKNKEDHVIKS
ncbi:adenylosuccinate synthetase [Candidatus Mycoplasma haematolamae str. Purdue]|uniref:Adenylosuccinate synthetase n=1 Tax=Mycoplasma haematolamae (strain Purdue) TaxID=1212765 RepID=I7CIG3_MYCHA|nr:adenylosuccinate synthase [Candidatus Mycoplasma haematolamae]AFO51644.1 adenylosuccinate synthetase [Candidatus Mycoplasma haematolamae str. Purdue]